MADTRSGAGQILQVGDDNDYTTLSGPDHDFGGLELDFDPRTFTTESGGLSTERNAGSVVLTGSFTIGETEVTNAQFLGNNGIRKNLRWSKKSGAAGLQMSAILTISHTFTARDKRMYSVDVHIDGTPTRWTA